MIKRIYIEITNVCNLSCAFCRKNHRPARFMSAAEFEHILKETHKLTPYIYLHVQGEPLLHPEFDEIMHIAAKYGCQVQLVTNALLLKEHMNLCDYEALRKISFSLQSIEYHQMPASEFMKPVIELIETASQNGRPYCELRFWRDDQMHMKRTEECLKIIHDKYEPKNSGRIKNEKILPNVYVDYSNPFEWPDIENTEVSDTGTCLGGVEQLAVLSDGTVIPCCLDADGEIALGNVFESPLEEILAGDRCRSLVDGFAKHHLNEELCRKCAFRKRFK